MLIDDWNNKVQWNIDICLDLISRREKRDLGFRMSIAGENAVNIMRIALGGVPESSFYQLALSLKSYASRGYLSKDYTTSLKLAYDYHREDTYVNQSTTTISTFEDVKSVFDEINNMVNEIRQYLVREGKIN